MSLHASPCPSPEQLGKRFLAVLRNGVGRRTSVETDTEGWLPVHDLLQECRVSFDDFCAAVQHGGRRFQVRVVDGQQEIRSTPKTPQKLSRQLLAVLRYGAYRGATVGAGSGEWIPVADLRQACRVSYDEFWTAVEQGGRRFELRMFNGEHKIRSAPKTCQGDDAKWNKLLASLAVPTLIEEEQASDYEVMD